MIFPVTITEKLEKTIEVEASSRNEALSLAKQNYYKGDPVLGAEDFTGETKFTIPRVRQYDR